MSGFRTWAICGWNMSTIIKRGLLALPIVVIGWVAVMALVMRFSDAAPAAITPLWTKGMVSALPETGAILGMNRYFLTVTNVPGTTKALYEAGAWIVLPAGLTGCLPLTKAQRQML